MARPIIRIHNGRPVHFPIKNAIYSPTRERKFLTRRRQSRHSTEIGSEYHRWWIVRNVLGCETNEHIAGLLLDGFHSVLQQLVIISGGELFDPNVHGLENVYHPCCSGFKTNSVPSESAYAAAPSSPPCIIEDLEAFAHYQSTIGHCCDYLWSMWLQQDKMQGIIHNLSPPLQQFLVKLIGYIRAAKGKIQNTSQKRKRPRTYTKQSNKVDRPEDQYMKSAQQRHAKVQPYYCQQFVGSGDKSERGRKLNVRQNGNSEQMHVNSSSNESCPISQKYIEDHHPSDHTFRRHRVSTDFGERSQKMSTLTYKKYSGSSVPSQESLSTDFMSDTPAALTAADLKNEQFHALGAPIPLRPSDDYHSTETPLASLPVLVKNIFHGAVGNAVSSSWTQVNAVPNSVSDLDSLSIHMPDHSTSGSRYQSSVKINSSTNDQFGNVSPLPSNSAEPIADEAPHTLIRPLSSKLYQQLSKESPSLMVPPLAKTLGASNGAAPFGVIGMHLYENADVTYSKWDNCSIFTVAHEASWHHAERMHHGHDHSERMHHSQKKATLLACQSLSNCNVSISPSMKNPTVTSKSSSKKHITHTTCSKLASKETVMEEKRPVSRAHDPNFSVHHVCHTCEIKFASDRDLHLHNYEQHSLVCGECDSRFMSRSDLLRHKETNHPPIQRCKQCRFVTFSREQLHNHFISKHGVEWLHNFPASDYLCGELQERNRNRSSSPRTAETQQSMDAPPDTHAHSQPCHPVGEEAMSSKNLLASEVLSSPGQCSAYTGESEHNHLDFHNIENACSESDEPCLVIDTSDGCDAVSKDGLEAAASASADNPLCLGFHTQDSVTIHHQNAQAEKQTELRQQQKFGHTKPYIVIEKTNQFSLAKSLPFSTDKHQRNENFQGHYGLQLSPDNLQEQEAEKETLSLFQKNCDYNSSTSCDRDDSSTSTACFAFRESPLNDPGRSDELDQSWDGQTFSNSRHTPKTKRNISPSEEQHQSVPRSNTINASGVPLQYLPSDSVSQIECRHIPTVCSLPLKKRSLRISPESVSFSNAEFSTALRDENIQETSKENDKNKSESSQSTLSNSTLELEREQNVSASAELERCSIGRKENFDVSMSSINHDMKTPEMKEQLSNEILERPEGKQYQNSETALRNRKHMITGEKTRPGSSTNSGVVRLIKDRNDNFTCPMPRCRASFSAAWTMQVHIERIHKKAACTLPLKDRQAKDRRYTCSWPECGKRFFARTHMRTHMLVHTGEKPIACQLCDYRCRQKTALIWHMRKHGVYSSKKKDLHSYEHAKVLSPGK